MKVKNIIYTVTAVPIQKYPAINGLKIGICNVKKMNRDIFVCILIFS